jgi:hypothetical protein
LAQGVLLLLLLLQVLVQAAGELRAAGRQLSGAGRLPLLLWVINQVSQCDTTLVCHVAHMWV